MPRKITQQEFIKLYITHMDDPQYRPHRKGQRQFLLSQLLTDHKFRLDLSNLCLRNLDFRYVDFQGLCMEKTDLRGANLSYATGDYNAFRGAQFDALTKLIGSNLMQSTVSMAVQAAFG